MDPVCNPAEIQEVSGKIAEHLRKTFEYYQILRSSLHKTASGLSETAQKRKITKNQVYDEEGLLKVIGCFSECNRNANDTNKQLIEAARSINRVVKTTNDAFGLLLEFDLNWDTNTEVVDEILGSSKEEGRPSVIKPLSQPVVSESVILEKQPENTLSPAIEETQKKEAFEYSVVQNNEKVAETTWVPPFVIGPLPLEFRPMPFSNRFGPKKERLTNKVSPLFVTSHPYSAFRLVNSQKEVALRKHRLEKSSGEPTKTSEVVAPEEKEVPTLDTLKMEASKPAVEPTPVPTSEVVETEKAKDDETSSKVHGPYDVSNYTKWGRLVFQRPFPPLEKRIQQPEKTEDYQEAYENTKKCNLYRYKGCRVCLFNPLKSKDLPQIVCRALASDQIRARSLSDKDNVPWKKVSQEENQFWSNIASNLREQQKMQINKGWIKVVSMSRKKS